MNHSAPIPLLARVLGLTLFGLVLSVRAATAQHKPAASIPAPSLEEEASAALTNSSPEVRSLADNAAAKYKKHDYAGAIADLDRLIAISPRLAGAYNARGFAKEHTHDLAGAEADFKRGVELAPKNPNGSLGLSNIKRMKGDLAGAAAEYHRVLQINPQYGPAYIGLGNVEFDKKEYPQAEADYNRAVALAPNNAAAWVGRGATRLAQNRAEDARTDVDHALTLDPKSGRAYSLRGAIKHHQGDVSGSLADYHRALELDPKASAVYREIAYDEVEQHRYEAALADVQRSPNGSPGSFADYSQFLAWSLRTRLGHSADADHQLSAYFATRPHTTAAEWPGHVGAFLLGREPEDALFAHAKSGDAKKIDGQRCEAWYYAGLKKLLAGDKAAAAEHFRQCVATGQERYYEYKLARTELQTL